MLDNEEWVFIEPSPALKAILTRDRSKFNIPEDIWNMIDNKPALTEPEVETVLVVSSGVENNGPTARAVRVF